MIHAKEKTAPITSVGADVGQSIPNNTVSIADDDTEYKKKLLEIKHFCDRQILQ